MKWRLWIKPERLIPSATILLAFTAQALDLFSVISLSLGEQIILLLLTLIAIDALTERITVLDGIKTDIKNIGRGKAQLSELLNYRSQLPPLEDRLSGAKSIDICGMSLLAISTEYRGLLLKKVMNGCRVRLIILNPLNESLMQMITTLVSYAAPEVHTHAITTSLASLSSDSAFINSDLVQIRLLDYPLAHGLFIMNGDTPTGEMRVELYMHNETPRNTPGFSIKREKDPEWFNYFLTEFQELWERAVPYNSVAT